MQTRRCAAPPAEPSAWMGRDRSPCERTPGPFQGSPHCSLLKTSVWHHPSVLLQPSPARLRAPAWLGGAKRVTILPLPPHRPLGESLSLHRAPAAPEPGSWPDMMGRGPSRQPKLFPICSTPGFSSTEPSTSPAPLLRLDPAAHVRQDSAFCSQGLA